MGKDSKSKFNPLARKAGSTAPSNPLARKKKSDSPEVSFNPLAINETLKEKVARFKIKFRQLSTSLDTLRVEISSSALIPAEVNIHIIRMAGKLIIYAKQLQQHADSLNISSQIETLEQSSKKMNELVDANSESTSLVPYLENAKKAVDNLVTQLENIEHTLS